MKIIKIAEENSKSLWDKMLTDRSFIYKTVFADQDEWAKKSEVFNKILQSEIKADPEERYESTNNPKAKTRNALIIRHIYKTQEEWEKDLLTNPYYQINK